MSFIAGVWRFLVSACCVDLGRVLEEHCAQSSLEAGWGCVVRQLFSSTRLPDLSGECAC